MNSCTLCPCSAASCGSARPRGGRPGCHSPFCVSHIAGKCFLAGAEASATTSHCCPQFLDFGQVSSKSVPLEPPLLAPEPCKSESCHSFRDDAQIGVSASDVVCVSSSSIHSVSEHSFCLHVPCACSRKSVRSKSSQTFGRSPPFQSLFGSRRLNWNACFLKDNPAGCPLWESYHLSQTGPMGPRESPGTIARLAQRRVKVCELPHVTRKKRHGATRHCHPICKESTPSYLPEDKWSALHSGVAIQEWRAEKRLQEEREEARRRRRGVYDLYVSPQRQKDLTKTSQRLYNKNMAGAGVLWGANPVMGPAVPCRDHVSECLSGYSCCFDH